MSFRVAPEVLVELHNRHAKSPIMWELQGTTLRYTMEVLFRQAFADTAVRLKHRSRKSLRPSLHGPGLMLAGMMIETLAKAVLVERKQTALILKQKKHNLRAAVAATGYSPSQNEIALLDRLSEFLLWAGRYPVPWKPEYMAVNDELGARNLVGGSTLGDDLVLARWLADGLENLLHSGDRVRTGMRLPTGRSSPDPRGKQRRG